MQTYCDTDVARSRLKSSPIHILCQKRQITLSQYYIVYDIAEFWTGQLKHCSILKPGSSIQGSNTSLILLSFTIISSPWLKCHLTDSYVNIFIKWVCCIHVKLILFWLGFVAHELTRNHRWSSPLVHDAKHEVSLLNI